MKISIITVCRNAESTIQHTLDSFFGQEYKQKEIFVIDGASTDRTCDILDSNQCSELNYISEPDNGIYNAMNKGLRLVSGEIVGILNSDDFYPHKRVLNRVAEKFLEPKIDAVFANINFVRPDDLNKVVRVYSSKNFTPDKFVYGYMPAHPSFFTKTKFYKEFGDFKTDYMVAADFELLIRFLHTHKLSYQYLDEVFVHMRTGGISNASFKNRYILNQEIVRACRENGLDTNLAKVLLKTFNKIKELRI